MGAASAVPHSPQKHLSAGLSAPHFGQRFASAAPQSPQNFLPAGFSVLQFEQRIGLHGKISDSPSYITQRRKGTRGIREDDRNPSPCRLTQYVTVVGGGGRDLCCRPLNAHKSNLNLYPSRYPSFSVPARAFSARWAAPSSVPAPFRGTEFHRYRDESW